MSARLEPLQVAALVPPHREPPSDELLDQLRAHVGCVLVVSDGMPAAALDELRHRVHARALDLLELDSRNGKGTAVAAGLELLVRRPFPPEAVIVVDADGQHPPNAIPLFLEAAGHADLVVGDRFGDLREMPILRRLANRIARAAVCRTTGRDVQDTQCGMRLLRGRALSEVRFPEAATRRRPSTSCGA